MNLVSSFLEIVQQVSCVTTVPTVASFVTAVTERVIFRRRTVTAMILAADAVKRDSGRGADAVQWLSHVADGGRDVPVGVLEYVHSPPPIAPPADDLVYVLGSEHGLRLQSL